MRAIRAVAVFATSVCLIAGGGCDDDDGTDTAVVDTLDRELIETGCLGSPYHHRG